MVLKIVIEQGIPNKPITVKVESDTVAEAVSASNEAIAQLVNTSVNFINDPYGENL